MPAARCQDWAARVLEAVWAPTWMVKGHVEDSKLMTGLIGGVAVAAVMVVDVVVERVDTRVADVLREGLGVVVDVVRGGVVRVRDVEEGADVTNFTLFFTYKAQFHALAKAKKSCLYCSFYDVRP